MDRRHMSFFAGRVRCCSREARSRVLWSCPAAGLLDVCRPRRSPPRSIHPHRRRQRMSKHAVFAATVLALSLTPVPARAQGRELTGRVTRALGQVPVGLATITEVGGQGVAQSGADGTFRISVAAGDVRLVVRAIGYQKKEGTGNAGESNVVVALAEDPFKLEAVVVTGQGTTLERPNATTTVSQVSNDELTRAPAPSLEQAMRGKRAGGRVPLHKGRPPARGCRRASGVTSILGNGQPLFVMDGVIISNDAISDGANSVT